MVRFKLMCPDCGAVVMTAAPEAVVWERCPSCRLHVWDTYDALLADVCPDNPIERVRNIQQSN